MMISKLRMRAKAKVYVRFRNGFLVRENGDVKEIVVDSTRIDNGVPEMWLR